VEQFEASVVVSAPVGNSFCGTSPCGVLRSRVQCDDTARGVLWASQIAIGPTSGLNIQVYGEKGSLTWRQSDPNTLTLCTPDGQLETKTCPPAEMESPITVELPHGSPSVRVEPLAHLYDSFAKTLIKSIDDGKMPDQNALPFPSVRDGVSSSQFTTAVIESSTSKEKWVEVG
jgi:predicted dehydrogenase